MDENKYHAHFFLYTRYEQRRLAITSFKVRTATLVKTKFLKFLTECVCQLVIELTIIDWTEHGNKIISTSNNLQPRERRSRTEHLKDI